MIGSGDTQRRTAEWADRRAARELVASCQQAQLYGAEVSRELISKVTDAVVEEMAEWQSRPLDAVYPCY